MDIEKVLTLSTAHLTKATGDLMSDEPERLAMTIWNAEYGWFLYAGAANPLPDRYVIPDDLAACMALATREGCTWLRLDRDGDLVEELPEYEW